MPKTTYSKKHSKTFSFTIERINQIKNLSKKHKITQSRLVEMGIDNLLMTWEKNQEE